MAKIPMSKLRKDLDRHRKALDRQLTAGRKKLARAVKGKDTKEAARIRRELAARRKAKSALAVAARQLPKACCDPFQNCPDI